MRCAKTPVAAIITAFNRPAETLATLNRLAECAPLPAEIWVHVDNRGEELATVIHERFPEVRLLVSDRRVGPGGGRNKLLQSAGENLVASFDDDSFPADVDFFARVIAAAANHPNAAILAADIMDGTSRSPAASCSSRVSSFVGCGCVYRRDVFMSTDGYVPLPLAFGMEEVDLALRLHALGRQIIHDPCLRVVHNLSLVNRGSDAVAAAMVSNVALLAFLRYPPLLWPLGIMQCIRKAVELLSHGLWRGTLCGLAGIPRHLWRYRKHRSSLTAAQVLSFQRLRHQKAA